MAKRFYKDVNVKPKDDAYIITLDARVLKTPGKQDLVITTNICAQLVAGEWRAQREEICPETMPCTRLMNVACEITPTRRPDLIKEFRSYCETDLMCFRAHAPQDLTERQMQNWQPVLDWAANSHKIALRVVSGVTAIAQPEISLRAAQEYAAALDNANLTLLLHFTASLGSGILALAILEKHLDIKPAYERSCLDELFQNERWGADEEAVLRHKNILAELRQLAKMI